MTLDFLSDGSIDFQATCGMMDLWAAAHLCQVKGDEIYVAGMHEMRRRMEEEAKKDPKTRLVRAMALPQGDA